MPDSFTKRSKNDWTRIAQLGTWVLGIVSGFVVAPQLGGPEEEASVWKLAQFVVNILVILMFIATSRFDSKDHLKHWIIATIATLLLGLAAYFSYLNQQGSCTCKYYAKTVLIGTHLNNPEKEGEIPCEELLKDHTGAVEEIWTKESINRCRLVLGMSYILTIPMFAICLISALQAFYINQKTTNDAV